MINQTVEFVIQDARQAFSPSAVIAGGFVRDTIFGLDPKDVDIWFDSHNDLQIADQWEWFARRLKADGLKPTGIEYSYNYHEQFDSRDFIAEVLKFTIDGTAFDIINVGENIRIDQDAYGLFEHFDFGICKAALVGSQLSLHPDFVTDLLNRTITLTMDKEETTPMNWERIHEYRLPRMQEKFPDFKVVGVDE